MNLKVRYAFLKLFRTSFTRLTSTDCREQAFHNREYKLHQKPTIDQEIQTKLLKIAIVGRPNAGKSTIINQLIGRQVCPMSCKQHTTKIAAKCVQTEGLTQLIYLDTPGLVTEEEFKRFRLDRNFKEAVIKSLKEADVISVIHDGYNTYTRHHLDLTILDLLQSFQSKKSFLVINKVDLLKKKRHLIYMTKVLTQGNSEDEKKDGVEGGSWPHFEEIFYVSAKTGDGIGDVKAYLMMQAQPGQWLFKADTVVDLPLPKLIINTLEASMLDALAQEIPRLLKIILRSLETGEDGSVYATLMVRPARKRHCAIIVGPGGMTLRKIVVIAERNLASALRSPVYLKVSICGPDE